MSEVTEYLDQKNIKYRVEGVEVIITCPDCRKEKLYINQKSLLYQCFVCKAENSESKYAKGHLSQLQEDFGDIIQISSISQELDLPKREKKEKDFSELVTRYKYNLSKSPNGLKYLYSRGFNDEDIDRFNFGFVTWENEDWISIPAYEDFIPKLIKYRKITDNTDIKKYRREFGSKSILYNQDILKSYDEVYICAGELDALTMIKYGYENTIAGTGGEGTLSPYYYDKLFLKEKFILVLDGDKAGQAAAKDVWATRLGIGRCWNVKLPEEADVNSFILDYGIEKFEEYLAEAYQYKIKGVISLKEALYQMYESTLKTDNVYPLPWENVNQKIGDGVEKKQLIVIGAQAGIGKTSMGIQIAHYFAKEYSMPSLTVCLEMSVIKLATKVVQIHNDLDYKEINPNEALSYIEDVEHLPMYFGYSPKITPEIYYNTVKEARNRYGCELFVFDNLQLLVVSDNESDYASAVKMFKTISMELDVIMLLISQPRKLNREGSITYDDLKGSASISQGADTVILLNRKRKEKAGESMDAFTPTTTVIIDKARFASGGRAMLEMIGAKSRFDRLKKD